MITTEEKMANDKSDIKSTAVVKFSNVENVASFQQLQQNFNLKEPPANWLHANSKWENLICNAALGKHETEFSSFNIAHCFPDLTGDIDVVADAENIKKLLKMPFGQKGHVSMMVHRVGNSLLLDDFDIHKHLLRQQQNDWQWLRKFYYDTVAQNMQDKNKLVLKKNKSRHFLQDRNMFSKFLYYSTMEDTDGIGDMAEDSKNTMQQHSVQAAASSTTLLPDPAHQSQQPEFQRTVSWTFEDIRMLIGTDLPIFGGGTHPCVSLRLRDMEKPINVLTGLDYWLDNQMCNVPELAMCYHVDGIVQKYELLKTEDIPDISGSKFSTRLVKDIAQNILSFLKSNATQEGHTYWLFKGSDDEVVKLYDLSTLCADYLDNTNLNPFTVPVGILLYRVARNMRQMQGKKKSSIIKTLLEHCLQLLDKEIHAQVITSANYILADLYIDAPAEAPYSSLSYTDAKKPSQSCSKRKNKHKSRSDESIEKATKNIASIDLTNDFSLDNQPYSGAANVDSSDEDQSPPTTVDVKDLCIPESIKIPKDKQLVRYPPIPTDSTERYTCALKHAVQGLRCLDMNASVELKGSKYQVDEQERCNPAEAIPLGDAPSTGERNKDMSVWTGSLPAHSWHVESKVLLLLKISTACQGLAELRISQKEYGHALKYLRLGLISFDAARSLNVKKTVENNSVLNQLLMLSADAFFMVAQCDHLTLQTHEKNFAHMCENEVYVQESSSKECQNEEFTWLQEFACDKLQLLEHSVKCYKLAQTSSKSSSARDKQNHLLKRLANALNELGVCYMNKGAQITNDYTAPNKEGSALWEQSMECMKEGIAAFQHIGDKTNTALLYCNIGRLMRMDAIATFNSQEKVCDLQQATKEFTKVEKQLFMKAIDQYETALQLLEKQPKQSNILASLNWEISTVYFTMATLFQDYAPLSSMTEEQVEREITDLMNKSLKYCDTESESVRLPTCQYRAATIHHRLASMYHKAYRVQLVDQKKKHLRQIAELHYNKAVTLFSTLESASELLRVKLEQVAMCEFLFSSQTSAGLRLQSLQSALSLLLSCDQCLHNLQQQSDTSQVTEVHNLLSIFSSRLNYILKNLLKTLSDQKKGKANEENQSKEKLLQSYKKLYGLVLKHGQKISDSEKDDKEITLKDILYNIDSLQELLLNFKTCS